MRPLKKLNVSGAIIKLEEEKIVLICKFGQKIDI
jgi:hypothetical protein